MPPQPVKQIALTDKQIDGVLAAKPEIDAIVSKLPEGNDKPDPKVLAQLEGDREEARLCELCGI